MKTRLAVAAAAVFFFGSLATLRADSIDITKIPGAAWDLAGGGTDPQWSHDGDTTTAWARSYSSHTSGNIDLIATLTFSEPVHVDSITAMVFLRTSSRSFQAGGSDQGRSADIEILYRTSGSSDFLRIPNPDAYERTEVKQQDGESTISWDRTLAVDLDSVDALRWRMSVASYTNGANAADGGVSAYEFSAVGVPEPSVVIHVALGALGALAVAMNWRRSHAA
jgi:hypothetical protein